MLSNDALLQLKQLKQDIHASRNLHRGTVRATGQKFGFVRLESGKDIYLPAAEMERVLPGDEVEIELHKESKQKTHAVLDKLIRGNTREFWGRCVVKGKAHFVEPDLPGLNRWIFLPPDKRAKAKDNDLVRCTLIQHPFKTGKAQARVDEVLGQQAGAAWDYFIRKNQLPQGWPKDVMLQLETLNEETVSRLAPAREDLTATPFVTIDARTTLDLDDALWADVTDTGWQLCVAIADPAALIAPGSALEQALLQRASSVYLPGQQIPMLPAKLSADLCSLVEGKDRLALVLRFELAPDGEVHSWQMLSAVVRSRRKLSYEDASGVIERADEAADTGSLEPEIARSLLALEGIGRALLNWRSTRLLPGMDRQDYYLELDDTRRIQAIRPKPETVAHRIVEETMILANRTVAAHLAERKSPGLFVGHAGVRADRLPILQAQIDALSLNLPSCDLGTLDGFVAVNRALAEDPNLRRWSLLLSRQLERAQISHQLLPHFGLGLPAYTTITSPLRKAVDFIAHRQLGQPGLAVDDALGQQIDTALQRVRSTQNELEQWLKCQFMERDSRTYSARVQRVFAGGIQVRLDDTGVEGTVEIRELGGKFSFNNELMTLTGEGMQFELEQSVRVKVRDISWQRRQIYFVLI
jgi:ribonuclease R